MPKTIETTVYTFDELSEDAKEKARDWFREGNLDNDWWDYVYEDADRVAAILGIEISRKTIKLMGGGIRQEPEIWFQGFHTQGSGSSFSGVYRHAKGSVKKIKSYAPQDKYLHSIAERLLVEQKTTCYTLVADIESVRDTSIRVTCNAERGSFDDSAVADAIKDFNNWIFQRLEAEYEYRMSDEVVDEDIKANEYTFTINGRRYG